MNLKTSDFDYTLPEELIATSPSTIRDQSRLLVVNNCISNINFNTPNNISSNISKIKNDTAVMFEDTQFNRIIDYLKPGDLIVFNNSKVIKLRALLPFSVFSLKVSLI